jgi:hypothetical protein
MRMKEKLFEDTGLQYEIHVLAEVAANGAMLALQSDMTTTWKIEAYFAHLSSDFLSIKWPESGPTGSI